MKLLMKVLAGAIPGAVLITATVFIIYCCCCRRRQQRQQRQQFISRSPPSPASDDTSQSAIAKLHLSHKSSSLRFQQLNHQSDHKQLGSQSPALALAAPFSWDDHPRLISEAAEHGWSRFTFSNPSSTSSVPRSSPLLNLCVVRDSGGNGQEDSRAAPSPSLLPASSEHMQTVTINPAPFTASKKSGSINSTSTSNSPLHLVDDSSSSSSWSSSSTRMSLPLPGPQLIGTSFPQEAYFEITIIYLQPPATRGGSRASKRAVTPKDDRVKLIQEQEEEGCNIAKFDDKDKKNCLISLGLTRGASPLAKSAPGTHPGSIGFHSNGCVYLDGMKLVSESERTEWAAVNRVIGCGFSPSKKKVYFTVGSEMVHVIRCSSDVYKSPMYPVLSSNCDVMMLVNLGQAAFKFGPANANRTHDPCFMRAPREYRDGSGVGLDVDSRELFTMGKLDSEMRGGGGDWRSRKGSRSESKASSGNWEDASVTVDIDGESDLFEISLNN